MECSKLADANEFPPLNDIELTAALMSDGFPRVKPFSKYRHRIQPRARSSRHEVAQNHGRFPDYLLFS
jgi:hypothetical protein